MKKHKTIHLNLLGKTFTHHRGLHTFSEIVKQINNHTFLKLLGPMEQISKRIGTRKINNEET